MRPSGLGGKLRFATKGLEGAKAEDAFPDFIARKGAPCNASAIAALRRELSRS